MENTGPGSELYVTLFTILQSYGMLVGICLVIKMHNLYAVLNFHSLCLLYECVVNFKCISVEILSFNAYYLKYDCYIFNIILFCANKNTEQIEILDSKGKHIGI